MMYNLNCLKAVHDKYNISYDLNLKEGPSVL